LIVNGLAYEALLASKSSSWRKPASSAFVLAQGIGLLNAA
jgi:hypothetical protein